MPCCCRCRYAAADDAAADFRCFDRAPCHCRRRYYDAMPALPLDTPMKPPSALFSMPMLPLRRDATMRFIAANTVLRCALMPCAAVYERYAIFTHYARGAH